ncbi:MAG: hypothetical protein Q8K78_13085 [Planctomycetaceae bacterium]|nr:hypothetical protein [Planctomycetaceae bacterium]
MTREAKIGYGLLLVGVLLLTAKGLFSERGLAQVYVKPDRVAASGAAITFVETKADETTAVFSPMRTAGVWVAAFLTLAIFSYLYRDNVFYKLAEAIIVGVSAGYAMVVGFWDSIIAQLMVELSPGLVQRWALPGIDANKPPDWTYLVPLILGGMLFLRFVPKVGWLSQWPLAFVVGTFAGLRLVLFLDADFVSQIRNTLLPLIVLVDGRFDFWLTLRNWGIIVSLLSCLMYFFFSFEHKGVVGRVARFGVWVLMIAFGASFAFTVMGRITLLTKRFEFLFYEWLRL